MISKFFVIFLSYVNIFSFLNGKTDYIFLQNQISDLYSKKNDAVIRVLRTVDPKKIDYRDLSTGFFIDNLGHVLTSNSDFEKSGDFFILFNRKTYESNIIGFDKVTGLGLLKLLDPPEKFSFIQVFPETKVPRTGSLAIAITQKLDLSGFPRISRNPVAYPRLSTVMGNIPNLFPFFRMDLKLFIGERGSPIFDLHGSFIGSICKSIGDVEESLILPSFAIDRIIRDLKVSGKVNYGWIGLDISTNANGEIYIKDISSDSPLATLDVQKNDLILSLGDYKINNYRDYSRALFYSRPDSKLKVILKRGLETKTFLISLKSRPILKNSQNESKSIQRK